MARKHGKDRGLVERPKGSEVWWVRAVIDGRERRWKVGSKTAARTFYAKIRTDAREGRLLGAGMLQTRIGALVTLGEAEAEANGRKSLKEIRRCAALIREHFGSMRAAEITTADMLQYRALRRAGALTTKDATKHPSQRRTTCVSDATVNRELAWMRHVYRLGERHDPPLVARTPHFPMVKERNVRTGFFEPVEFQRLRDHLPDHLKPVVTLGYLTGMRLGEIVGLCWTQIDWEHGTLRLDPGTTKNGEGRTIPLPPEARAALEAWRLTSLAEWPTCPWVCHYRGEKIERITRSWRTACQKAGLPGKLFHDFRRSAVRNLIRAGVPQVVAKKISGHKTDSVFSRYNIVSPEDLTDAAARLTRYLQAQTPEIGTEPAPNPAPTTAG